MEKARNLFLETKTCSEARRGKVRARRQKANSQQTRMCVGLKKVQSDDPQPPDSL